MSVRYLSVEEVLHAHGRVKAIPFARVRDNVHRMELLESALARPQHAAQYEEADLVRQAATLLWGLVRDHPFSDGNKRTAYVATETFLDLNGHTLRSASVDARFRLLVSVADGRSTVDDVERSLRRHIRPLRPPRSERSR
ncbi:MAG: type II toxin-antitoxin system death-on-curing family toxin [Candidatus Limnocylindria bacterium]